MALHLFSVGSKYGLWGTEWLVVVADNPHAAFQLVSQQYASIPDACITHASQEDIISNFGQVAYLITEY